MGDTEISESYKSAAEDYYEVKEVDRRLSYFLARPTSIICDVGSGSGIDAFPLAMAGSLCVCLDVKKYLLMRGKILSKRSKIPEAKLEFILASATNLPFRRCSIDLITCFSVLDHLPTVQHVQSSLYEFSRAVKSSGHVAVTFPNKLFVIGTISMGMRQLLQRRHCERRFTPQQMQRMMILSGLRPIAFHSKYPTKAGDTFLRQNLPSIPFEIPKSLIQSSFVIAENLFRKIEKRKWLKFCGARFGYLCRAHSGHEP